MIIVFQTLKPISIVCFDLPRLVFRVHLTSSSNRSAKK